jgi:hypothetical protein
MTTTSHFSPRGPFIFACIVVMTGGAVRILIAHPPPIPPQTIMQPALQKPSPKALPKASPKPSPPAQPLLPPKPTYTITPISPTSGAIDDFSLILRECHHTDDAIWCSAQVTNLTDARALLQTGSLGNSVDDEGNSAQVMFSAIQQSLIPGVATNLQFRIYDKHQSAKSVNLDLLVDWEIDRASYHRLIYKDVPVQ